MKEHLTVLILVAFAASAVSFVVERKLSKEEDRVVQFVNTTENE